jgi:V8-like Glu-specific endopeptidase
MASLAHKLFGSSRRRAPSAARTWRPQLEALEERSLMSASPIAPTHLTPMPSPNTADSSMMGIVELKVTYPDQQTAMGTGTMIDATHVLTAAHLLYSANDGGYATSVEAIPGNGLSSSLGVAFGTKEHVDPSWLGFNASHPSQTSPAVADVGLVTLNRALGNQTGWFAVADGTSKDSFSGATFDTAGYPGNPTNVSPQLHIEAGKAEGTVSSNGISFTQSSLPALPGQSGSPIYQISHKGSEVIYGVLTGADGFSPTTKVFADRITPRVYEEIQDWEKGDKTPLAHAGAQATLEHPVEKASPVQGNASTGPTIHALSWPYNPSYDYAGDFNYNVYNPNFGYGSSYAIPPSPLEYGGVGDGLNTLATMYGSAAVVGAGMAASPYLFAAAEPYLYGLGYGAYKAYQSNEGQFLSGFFGPTTGPSGNYYQDLGNLYYQLDQQYNQ